MRWRAALWVVLALALAEAKAEPLLREWIARQAEIRSLHADFEQTRRLPALRIPLKSSGTLWLDARGSFRWQVGDPPELLAIRAGERLLVIDPKKKRARILEEDPAAGPLRLDAIGLPFASSYADLENRFAVLAVEERGELVEAVLKPKEARLAAGVKSVRVVFRRASGVVELFELELRDGSQISTAMSRVEINPRLPAGVFEFDLSGYQIDDRSASP
jgi:outer membrane lipoprotein-sorting protein